MIEDLFDMFQNLKGMPVEVAKSLVPSSYIVRVSEKDSPITAEYMPERLNLVIDNNGIVEETFWG